MAECEVRVRKDTSVLWWLFSPNIDYSPSAKKSPFGPLLFSLRPANEFVGNEKYQFVLNAQRKWQKILLTVSEGT